GREILAQNLLEIGFGDGDALLQHQGIGAGGGIAVHHDQHAGETDADHDRGHDELDQGDPALAGAASAGHHRRSTKPVAAYTRKERVMIVTVTSLLARPSGVNTMSPAGLRVKPVGALPANGRPGSEGVATGASV